MPHTGQLTLSPEPTECLLSFLYLFLPGVRNESHMNIPVYIKSESLDGNIDFD